MQSSLAEELRDLVPEYRTLANALIRGARRGRYRTAELGEFVKVGDQMREAISEVTGWQPREEAGDPRWVEPLNKGAVESINVAATDLRGVLPQLLRWAEQFDEDPFSGGGGILDDWWRRHLGLIHAEASIEEEPRPTLQPLDPDACKKPERVDPTQQDLLTIVRRLGGLRRNPEAIWAGDAELEEAGLLKAKGMDETTLSERLWEAGFLTERDERAAYQLVVDTLAKGPDYMMVSRLYDWNCDRLRLDAEIEPEVLAMDDDIRAAARYGEVPAWLAGCLSGSQALGSSPARPDLVPHIDWYYGYTANAAGWNAKRMSELALWAEYWLDPGYEYHLVGADLEHLKRWVARWKATPEAPPSEYDRQAYSAAVRLATESGELTPELLTVFRDSAAKELAESTRTGRELAKDHSLSTQKGGGGLTVVVGTVLLAATVATLYQIAKK